MINDIQKDADQRMDKTIESFRHDLAKVRTGRAHPSLLEHITVPYYGAETPINQVASISVQEGRTLVLQIFDKGAIQDTEKAILKSDLGLTPNVAGQVIRITMPPLNEERRKELIKVVRGEAENAKVAIRNIRRDANNSVKELEKEKEITEDDLRRAEEQIQKLTDAKVAKVDEFLEEKEQELMEI
ncbi:ribosome recycling factor [Kangiella sediminilitoris]|uniref:Ribosome-recycling factor n=1 Tax=Kangiella sediminilitoris TaxID=1144748 RepID=A0A1B3BC33_9GAMM|nr:ribosome recycling factor [Kangiella sediminilitoris]AOE50361.1 ribosome recycling factor [Kangiella sediminilitoris]